MEIHVQLFSILRDILPPEAKGRAVLQLNAGATIADLLEQLGISGRVVISVNADLVTDRSYQLKDGDRVKILSSISGG